MLCGQPCLRFPVCMFFHFHFCSVVSENDRARVRAPRSNVPRVFCYLYSATKSSASHRGDVFDVIAAAAAGSSLPASVLLSRDAATATSDSHLLRGAATAPPTKRVATTTRTLPSIPTFAPGQLFHRDPPYFRNSCWLYRSVEVCTD